MMRFEITDDSHIECLHEPVFHISADTFYILTINIASKWSLLSISVYDIYVKVNLYNQVICISPESFR